MLNFYFPMDGLFEAGRLEGTWVLALVAEGREDAGRREGSEDTRGEDTGREDAGRREGREDKVREDTGREVLSLETAAGGTQKPLHVSTMLVGPTGPERSSQPHGSFVWTRLTPSQEISAYSPMEFSRKYSHTGPVYLIC
jgi:hypothetical protein